MRYPDSRTRRSSHQEPHMGLETGHGQLAARHPQSGLKGPARTRDPESQGPALARMRVRKRIRRWDKPGKVQPYFQKGASLPELLEGPCPEWQTDHTSRERACTRVTTPLQRHPRIRGFQRAEKCDARKECPDGRSIPRMEEFRNHQRKGGDPRLTLEKVTLASVFGKALVRRGDSISLGLQCGRWASFLDGVSLGSWFLEGDLPRDAAD